MSISPAEEVRIQKLPGWARRLIYREQTNQKHLRDRLKALDSPNQEGVWAVRDPYHDAVPVACGLDTLEVRLPGYSEVGRDYERKLKLSMGEDGLQIMGGWSLQIGTRSGNVVEVKVEDR